MEGDDVERRCVIEDPEIEINDDVLDNVLGDNVGLSGVDTVVDDLEMDDDMLEEVGVVSGSGISDAIGEAKDDEEGEAVVEETGVVIIGVANGGLPVVSKTKSREKTVVVAEKISIVKGKNAIFQSWKATGGGCLGKANRE